MKPDTVISSANNQQIKNISLLLKKSKAREEQGLFVIEGLRIFEEARLYGSIARAYFSESFYQEKHLTDPDFFHDLEYEIVSDKVFQGVSETVTPQGVLALVRRAQYLPEQMIVKDNPCLLLLEDIRDPGNLGTMIRTAEGAGMSGIILNNSCVDIYNPKVIRSTMGSIFRVPFYRADDFPAAVRRLKERGIKVFAAHLTGQPYDTEGGFLQGSAILIGNEANGLSEEASALADRLIRIPMEGRVESLNAAVAAAILMYEAYRQRRQADR
jgi:TrmH family RNA methyltransferase